MARADIEILKFMFGIILKRVYCACLQVIGHCNGHSDWAFWW